MKQRLTLYIFILLFVAPALAVAQAPGLSAINQNRQPVDTELLQSKIMLLDATLDLNQALLQGVKASLDSLNLKDKGIIDEKNMQATIHSMQRRRDKALLTPYLLHMQDSLNIEITKEQNEKANLEYTLTGIQPMPAQPYTSAALQPSKTSSVTPVENANNTTTPAKDTGALPNVAVTSNKQVTAKGRQSKPAETTTIVSAAPAVIPNFDSLHIRPVIESGSQVENASPSPVPVKHWETAKALYDTDDTTNEWRTENEVAEADTQTLQNSRDSGAYIPSVVLYRRGGGGQSLMSDSVRLIKAELYLTKARKSSNEKNYKTAIEDLKKSIDLMPSYYDAWLALGDADAHLGLYTKAFNEYKTCVALDSNKATLFYKLGGMLLKLKQRDGAYTYFNKSLSLDSVYIPAIMSRALIFAERKEYSKAINEYTRVLNLDRGYHTAYRAKAMAEYRLKNYDAAVDDFTRFMIFDETDASTYYYRGLAHLGLHQQADACADLSFSAKMGYAAALKALEARCK